MSDEPEKQQAAMLAAYEEVCRSYHAVDDFRAKLLALLPFASGAGGTFLLGNRNVAAYLGPIGLLGIGMTLGLFFYDLRGLKLCDKFVKAGRDLESGLGLQIGQFQNNLEERFLGIIGAGAAGCTVYLSVLLGWIYIAYVGFKCQQITTGG